MAYFVVFLFLSLLLEVENFPLHLKSSATVGSQIDAVYGLIQRLLGNETVSYFNLTIIPPNIFGNDKFVLSAYDGRVSIQGTSGVSLASGLNWYLKYYCQCDVSWGRNGTGDQLKLPKPLPSTSSRVEIESPVKFRYYMNVVTYSYSTAWWQWDRWEREIDWMALNGINMPLSFTGQEYIWEKLYTQVGMTKQEIDSYFTGPAFLPFNRLGLLKMWLGVLPPTWREEQAALQKKILQRQREFGMICVLPGFAGHVPAAFKRIYPNTNFTSSGSWARFGPTYSRILLLEPIEPLFSKIGFLFTSLLISEFGTDHVYNADTYNELTPPTNNTDFLRASSKSLYLGMQAADPLAVWLMQGWLFEFDSEFWGNPQVEAYLSGVSRDQIIILDLASDINPQWNRTKSYFGKAWIWCMLHNFGGNSGIYGDLDLIGSNPVIALNTPGNSMLGIGLTMEGIEQNPVVYNMMSEMGWHDNIVNASTWLQSYVVRRYNANSTTLQTAWDQLYNAVYRGQGYSGGLVVSMPTLEYQMSQNTKPNTTLLVKAWRNFVRAAINKEVSVEGPFAYDLVDVTRQAMVNFFYDLYNGYYYNFLETTNRKIPYNETVAAMQAIAPVMLDLILDLDRLLGTNINFMLGPYLNDAANNAQNSDQVNMFLRNAKNLLTLWGPNGEINDYASRQWNGLVGTYYYTRWEFLIETVNTAVVNEYGVDWDLYYDQTLETEQFWGVDTQTFQNTSVGDTLTVVSEMLQKYGTSNSQYIIEENEDAPGYDIQNAWTTDIQQLMILCDLNPNCKGFNQGGWLKRNITGRVLSQGIDLYIKVEQL